MARSESENSRSRGNRDVPSSLPDSLLHHIMSFMPVWQTVLLCVLSKRWKTLWTALPVLNYGYIGLWNNQLDYYKRCPTLPLSGWWRGSQSLLAPFYFSIKGQHMLSDQIEVAWFKCEPLETIFNSI